VRANFLTDPGDPVLEFHIAGDRFMQLLRTAHWRAVIEQEFHSLVPLLQSRDETALVGSTILRRQVADFGASLRELPPGCTSRSTRSIAN
jgi:hypothetical protein